MKGCEFMNDTQKELIELIEKLTENETLFVLQFLKRILNIESHFDLASK